LIVDFPGFSDTKGPIVGLFMQIVLSNIITNYKKTTVLLIEDITNHQGGYKNAKDLADLVTRLTKDSKENVLLGLTKYQHLQSYKNLRKSK